jgi:hypothetical protein
MIFMQQMSVQHVSHRLKSAVWMGRESGDVIVRFVRIELIQHQEWVQFALGCNDPNQPDATAIGGRAAGQNLDDGTFGHAFDPSAGGKITASGAEGW